MCHCHPASLIPDKSPGLTYRLVKGEGLGGARGRGEAERRGAALL